MPMRAVNYRDGLGVGGARDGCEYVHWDRTRDKLVYCNLPTVVGKNNHSLCQEHAEFIRDCEFKGVQTSDGLRTWAEVKKMFKPTHKPRPTVCPHCGGNL